MARRKKTAAPKKVEDDPATTPNTEETAVQTAVDTPDPNEPEAPPAPQLEKPAVERGILVKVKLVGQRTAVLAGRSVLEHEVHEVTYAAFCVANKAHPRKFQIKHPDSIQFVIE